MTTQKRRTPIVHRSTQRVLDILSTLSETDNGMSMSDICRKLSIPKGSLSPILHTMTQMGYVAYEQTTARYSLGLRSFLLASSYERKGGILPVFKKAMHQIVDICDETCQLGILDYARVLYIAKVDSAQPVQLKSNIGKTLGISYTAIGKVLIADLSDEDIHSLVGEKLEAPTKHAAKTADELISQLVEVRKTGFGYDREETTEGVQCIAVPIYSHKHALYGLSVTLPSYRLTSEKEELIKHELLQAKKHIEQLIH